jgi:hypothetical protein
MRKYTTVEYHRRNPQVKMICTLPPAPVTPPVPPVPPTPPVVVYYTISGTYGDEFGSGGFENYFVTNGTATWIAAIATGSYGFDAPSGWSGSIATAQYISDPGSHAFVSVAANQAGNNFDNPYPFAFIAGPLMAWSWPLVDPERWLIIAKHPTTLVYSAYGTVAGTVSNFDTTPSFGTLFSVIGLDYKSDYNTNVSNEVVSSAPIIALVGSVFTADTGSGFPANIHVSGVGTYAADENGVWFGLIPYGYSGSAAVADVVSGSFEPAYRAYSGIIATQTNQDFVFHATAPPAPTDCQIPLALQTITDLPEPRDVSRSVNDPVNNLLWYLDDTYDRVYYVDPVAGTYQGSIVMPAEGGQSAIVYDPTNNKVVVMGWAGSIHVIDTMTKVLTGVPGAVLVDPSFHTLAVDDNGTAYACSRRNNTLGRLYAIDTASATLIKDISLTVYTDSICWASNIDKLVINAGGGGSPAFYIFDPAMDTFAASVLTLPTTFRYENFYIPQTGHMLESNSATTTSAVIAIAQGTDATVVKHISPARISNAAIDTCSNRLFISDGAFALSEYTLDGSYTRINVFDGDGEGILPASCSHNRQSNLVYVADYGDGTIYTYKATTQSGSLTGMVWRVEQGITPIYTGGYMAAAGSTLWLSGSSVGSTGAVLKVYDPSASTAIVNLGEPYPVDMTLVYMGSIQDSGTITNPSRAFMRIAVNSTGTDFTVTGTNGVFGGTLSNHGTVNTGYNTFEVSSQFYGGGNTIPAPCNTYVAISGTLIIAP